MDLRELYPEKSQAELKAIEDNWLAYLACVIQIYQRIRKDPEAYTRFQELTAARLELRLNEPAKSNTPPSAP